MLKTSIRYGGGHLPTTCHYWCTVLKRLKGLYDPHLEEFLIFSQNLLLRNSENTTKNHLPQKKRLESTPSGVQTATSFSSLFAGAPLYDCHIFATCHRSCPFADRVRHGSCHRSSRPPFPVSASKRINRASAPGSLLLKSFAKKATHRHHHHPSAGSV